MAVQWRQLWFGVAARGLQRSLREGSKLMWLRKGVSCGFFHKNFQTTLVVCEPITQISLATITIAIATAQIAHGQTIVNILEYSTSETEEGHLPYLRILSLHKLTEG